MTELELRNKVVDVMRGWLGWSEANGKFRSIIDLYNTQRPLPRGYAVQYDDEWCATCVTAAGIQAGLHDIILGECGCGKMIELYRAAGRWEENDAYRPEPATSSCMTGRTPARETTPAGLTTLVSWRRWWATPSPSSKGTKGRPWPADAGRQWPVHPGLLPP